MSHSLCSFVVAVASTTLDFNFDAETFGNSGGMTRLVLVLFAWSAVLVLIAWASVTSYRVLRTSSTNDVSPSSSSPLSSTPRSRDKTTLVSNPVLKSKRLPSIPPPSSSQTRSNGSAATEPVSPEVAFKRTRKRMTALVNRGRYSLYSHAGSAGVNGAGNRRNDHAV